jgi:hypothetical protein
VILERIKREPALVYGLVGTVISLLLAFGFPLNNNQVGAIMAVVVAILAILTRQVVIPAKAVTSYETIKGEVVTGPAAPPEGEPAAVVVSADGTGLNPDVAPAPGTDEGLNDPTL